MKNRKALIIENDKKSLGELEEILAMGGYDPVVVNNALWAVDTVIRHRPDVILMELKMPHKNGFELADAISQISETRRVPIIAMSSFFKDEFRWLLDFYGIKRWIKKPFRPLDVIWAIENEIKECNEISSDDEKEPEALAKA